MSKKQQSARKIIVTTKSQSAISFHDVVMVGVALARAGDMAGYRKLTAYIGANKHQLTAAFGRQDLVVDLSHRNWVWTFDSDRTPEICKDTAIILSLWLSKRGASFEVSFRDGSPVDVNCSATGAAVRDAIAMACARLYAVCPELVAT